MPAVELSEATRARYRAKAERLIFNYDFNQNGTLDTSEPQRLRGQHKRTIDARDGFSDWVTRTTITYHRFSGIKSDEFQKADADQDGHLTADELVDAYVARRDTNQDGRLSLWERFKAFFSPMSRQFEATWDVEVKRETRVVYDPLPRPIPPSSGGDRPTPPPSGDDRPTPPDSGEDRPTPPSAH